MKNLWHYQHLTQPLAYGCDTTYHEGMAWLEADPGIHVIEDWGCGGGYARRFVRRARYVGIDGSPAPWTDRVVDLTSYRSNVDGLFMRHVLEHNPAWPQVLRNAVASFNRRFVLILFTPQAAQTGPLPGVTNSNGVPDIAFNWSDLTHYLDGCTWRSRTIETQTQYGTETVFFVNKNQSTPAPTSP